MLCKKAAYRHHSDVVFVKSIISTVPVHIHLLGLKCFTWLLSILQYVFVDQRRLFLEGVRIRVSRGSSCLMMSEPDSVFSGVGGELASGGICSTIK